MPADLPQRHRPPLRVLEDGREDPGDVGARAGRSETLAETLVAMAPVVEGMGLDWKTQHRKLEVHPVLVTCVGEITTQMPGDDQARRYTALPLNRLNFWLATIHPNKVPGDAA